MGVIPAVRVELIVPDPNIDALTLDDPVRGELDNVTYPLFEGAATTTVALESEAFAYVVRRGRENELVDVSTGTMAVEFRNFAGAFVPYTLVDSGVTDESGNYLTDDYGAVLTTEWAAYGHDAITPGRRVRLYLDDVVVFDGRVDDWELEYGYDGSASASMVAVDALGVLAEAELTDWSTSAQTASARITAVLDRPEVDFPATRDIGTAENNLTNDTVAGGTNALTYVRLVTYSDLGYVYASRAGLLTFEPRRSITSTVRAEFADDGTAIPFDGVSPASSTRYMFNRVSVTRLGGTEQLVEDAASQALYGIRTLTLTDLLMNSDVDALNFAGSLLALYKSPASRLESLSVNLGSLTESQRATVLSLELGDFIAVTWTPRGTDAVTQALRVEGIELGCTFDGVGALSLSLSPAEYFPLPFILDDAADGVLDTSQIFY